MIDDPLLTGQVVRTLQIKVQPIDAGVDRPMVPLYDLWIGAPIIIRNRFGIYRVTLRTIGRCRGKWFVVGHSERYICHRAWLDNVIRVDKRRLK